MVTDTAQPERRIPRMDWGQVILNGGPPCFFVEGPQFCGRAERWQGYGNSAFHNYVSLEQYIADLASVPVETELPWNVAALAGWDIVGMNHYLVGGERRLFVAMMNGFRCIRAEGASESEVFKVLADAALAAERVKESR